MNDNPSNFRPQGSASGSQQYLDANIRMASPAKMRLMLLERSVEVARMLSANWRSKESTGANELSLQLMELLGELLSGVAGGSNEAENKLCLQVADLYVFLLQHLVVAEQHSDFGAIDEMQIVLEAETETWRSVVAQELSARAGATIGGPAPVPAMASGQAGQPSSGGLNFSA